MKARSLIISTLLAAACAASFPSCKSAPKPVPEDLDAPVLVQRAQEASDKYDYATALAYYRALGERFGGDPAYLAASEYEIAFIAYKEGRLGEAKAGFEALLGRYSGQDGAAYPERYRILATKVLEGIEAQSQKK